MFLEDKLGTLKESLFNKFGLIKEISANIRILSFAFKNMKGQRINLIQCDTGVTKVLRNSISVKTFLNGLGPRICRRPK